MLGEGRLDHLILCEQHRLKCAGHASVPVAERVDHDEIQVGHRSAHERLSAVGVDSDFESERINSGTRSPFGPA